MSYRSEFIGFDPTTMPTIPEGFVDTSWHNDSCPSFTFGDSDSEESLILWIEPADPALRDTLDTKRFHLQPGPYGEARSCLVETDDWQEVLAAIEAHKPLRVIPSTLAQ